MKIIRPTHVTDTILTDTNVPELPAWSAGDPLTTARDYLAGAGVLTAALAFGGYDGADSAVTEEYDGAAWSGGGALANARRGLAGAGTQTAGLSFGGYDGAASTVTEEYDGTVWSAGGSLATGRYYPAGAGTQTAALSFGGTTGADSAVTEEYNGAVWSAGGALATAREGLAGAGTLSAALSFGGHVAAASAITEEYDGAAWSAGGSLATARQYLAGGGTQSAGISFGGLAVSTLFAVTERYDGTVWSATSAMATARYGLAGAGTQSAALSFGGYTTGEVGVTEEYTSSLTETYGEFRVAAWSVGGSLATARFYLAGAGTLTSALSFGGNAAGHSAVTEEYNGTVWSASGALATARTGLAGCGTQSAALSFGGLDGAVSAVTEEYDGATWSAGGALATARNYLAGCGTQSAALSFGGTTGAVSAVTEEYNGTAWSAGAALATARSLLAGAGTSTSALSFGGSTGAVSAVTEEYNGIAWSTGGGLVTSRSGIAGCGTQSAALSYGGASVSASRLTNTEEYDGAAWATRQGLNTGCLGQGGAGVSSSALSFGGDDTGSATGTTEEYESYAVGDRAILVNPSATVTLSTGGDNLVTWASHGIPVGTPVQFTTTGVLPSGVSASTRYYVAWADTDTFTISAEKGGTTLVIGGTQSGVHTAVANIHKVYESLRSGNGGNWPLTEVTWWIEVGATNRWRMFDESVSSLTSNPDSLDVEFVLAGRVDSVALLNINAATAQIVMTDSVEGIVFDQTYSLTSSSSIGEWYSYFFEPIVRLSDFTELGLPPYADPTLRVTLTDAGNTVACGACVVGLSRDLGYTQYGMGLGIQDYSVKQQDDFGNYTILERAFNKQGKFSIWIKNPFVDEAQRLLSEYRATPVVYVGSEDFGSSVLYGFYKDFTTVISYPDFAVCDIEIEGLT